MTERERIEKTYSSIRKKNPDITDDAQLVTLAIKTDQKRTILHAFAWLSGGIVSCVIWLALMGSDKDSLTLIFMMMAGSGLFEFYRTLGKYSGIEKRYRPIADVKYEGIITNELILKRGGKTLKKANKHYLLKKLLLTDKNDELSTGTDNETLHEYFLCFDRDGLNKLKVKRNVYLNAVLGVSYIAVLTVDETGQECQLVDAYPVPNWELAEDLRDAYQDDDFDQINETAQALKKTKNTSKKSSNTLPVISLVLSALSMLLAFIIAIPMNLAALITSHIAFAKTRSKLSVVSVIVSIICSAITVLAFLALLCY